MYICTDTCNVQIHIHLNHSKCHYCSQVYAIIAIYYITGEQQEGVGGR